METAPITIRATPYDTDTGISILVQTYDPQTGQYSEGTEYQNRQTVPASAWPGKITITCTTDVRTVVYTVKVDIESI